jgi:hypothetical protein
MKVKKPTLKEDAKKDLPGSSKNLAGLGIRNGVAKWYSRQVV